MPGDVKLSACWEATQPYLCFCIYFSPYLTIFYLVFAFIFTFLFAFGFDVCCCFSISSLGAKEKRTSKEEIQPQKNSRNKEKNATDANSR